MTALVVHRYGDGSKPTVVLLHGLTEAGTGWPDLVERWDESWDIVAPDLRGHGRSPRFAEAELAAPMDVLLTDVLALLDSQPAPVVLVGHSLGGLLGLRATLARPDLVRALVLEDPARPSPTGAPDPGHVAETEAFVASVTSDPAGESARMARETRWSAAEIAAWAECKALVDRAYLHRALFLGDTAWEELFERLTVPTLLVVPPESEMAPRGVRNPLVHTVVVPDSGHCVRRDQPDQFHAAVETFLSETA